MFATIYCGVSSLRDLCAHSFLSLDLPDGLAATPLPSAPLFTTRAVENNMSSPPSIEGTEANPSAVHAPAQGDAPRAPIMQASTPAGIAAAAAMHRAQIQYPSSAPQGIVQPPYQGPHGYGAQPPTAYGQPPAYSAQSFGTQAPMPMQFQVPVFFARSFACVRLIFV